MARTRPSVVLFGYDSSTFTLKVRLALRLKQIPYTFVAVPSMMPRPQLRDTFNLTYRKIPVLAINRDLYCDSSLILEALEHRFPPAHGYRTLYPAAADGRLYRPLIRGFASYWTDRPLFRVACGLMPASIWRSGFGRDRAQLIGHALDADKLERKLPENLARLDQQLAMLEPLFAPPHPDGRPWIFSTSAPSLADLALYYELAWAREMASGAMTEDITAGEAVEQRRLEGADPVFNARRYPGVSAWFAAFRAYVERLPTTEGEEDVEEGGGASGVLEAVLSRLRAAPLVAPSASLLPTPRPALAELDARCGLSEGALVSVVPDDTGKDDPTIGSVVALSPEEIVISPKKLDPPASVDVHIHFPRLGFVARPVKA